MRPILLALSCLATLYAQDNGTVSGRVIDSATGLGLPGVTVSLKARKVNYQTVSDESGLFRLTGVKYGDYGAGNAQKQGYNQHQEGPLALGGGVRVNGPDPVMWNIRMDPWVTLRGRVLDADGKPAAKVHVRLEPDIEDTDTVTDQNGGFIFKELKPGAYILCARPDPRPRVQEGIRVEAVPTYFPSTAERPEAEPVVLRAGVDPPDYDIRLRTLPVYRVRGVVLNAEGKPAANATIKLLRASVPGTQGYGIAFSGTSMSMISGPGIPKKETEEVSGEDGSFEFASVQPGDWRFEAQADPRHDPARDRSALSSAAVSAAVGARDIDNLEIRLAAPFDLDLISDWGDAPPPTDERMTQRGVLLLPLDGQPAPDHFNDPREFAHLTPGRYRIVPPLPRPGFYVSSLLLGSREVLGQEVELTPGSPPLRIVYKTAGLGSIRGTVEDGDQATVVLVSQASAQDGSVLSYVRTMKCGGAGVFDSGGIPAGDYYAAAFDRFDAQTMITADFITTVKSLAATARVEDGAATSVELRLAHWPL